MSSRLELIIYSVSGKQTKFDGIDSINVRLTDGSLLGIHPGHDHLIGMTDGTDFIYTQGGREISIDVSPGMLTVEKNVVKVFTTF